MQTGTVAKNSDAVRNTVKPMKDDIGEAAFGNQNMTRWLYSMWMDSFLPLMPVGFRLSLDYFKWSVSCSVMSDSMQPHRL